jgi:hypothetical protein
LIYQILFYLSKLEYESDIPIPEQEFQIFIPVLDIEFYSI